MQTWTGLGFLALGLTLQGCSTSDAPVQRELIIAPAPVACAGAPPDTCLSVTEPNGDEWLMRFDEIDGFAYEPGYTYRVLVEEPPLNEERAVVPRLRLVRVVSEEPAAGAADDSALGRSEWELQSITPAASGDQDWSDSEITARFHVGGGWTEGFGGCNPFLAALAVDGEKITMSAPVTTLELCAVSVEDRQRTYLQALAKAQSYAVTGDRLELRLLDGGRMRFRAAGG
ncbi:MAG: META domain-containing protein [Geminicoccaceae bacterium]